MLYYVRCLSCLILQQVVHVVTTTSKCSLGPSMKVGRFVQWALQSEAEVCRCVRTLDSLEDSSWVLTLGNDERIASVAKQHRGACRL